MTRNQIVFAACFGILCFWIGMNVGEEQSAVELKPFPKAEKKMRFTDQKHSESTWAYYCRKGIAKCPT